MQSERRALTEDEKQQISGPFDDTIGWTDYAPLAFFLGMLFGLVYQLAVYLFTTFGEADPILLGCDLSDLLLPVWLGSSACTYLLLLRSDLRNRREVRARRALLFASDKIPVELHEIQDCKLLREPEHGMPMFFLQGSDGAVIFVMEPCELEEDWEDDPLRLPADSRPRRHLKILRHPQTKDCVLTQFQGEELEVSNCYEIGLKPEQWPADGAILRVPWAEVEKRYRLLA